MYKEARTDMSSKNSVKPCFTYIDSTEQKQSRAEAHSVDGTQNKGDQEEPDAHWLG